MLKHVLLKNQDKGYDGGKKIAARKRHIVLDTMGYPINIDVLHGTTPHDSNCAKKVLFGLKEKFPRLIKILADRGYQQDVQQWFDSHTEGCLLSIIKLADCAKGFQIQRSRWLVERSFAWLANFRRLSKDYEMTTSSAKAFIQLAFLKIMMKRLS